MASRLRRIPKARFIWREDITNAMGEHPVYITYSVDRKTAKTDTTVWIKREHWNDSRQCVKASHPRHDQLNAILQVKRHEIDDRLVELNPEITLEKAHVIDPFGQRRLTPTGIIRLTLSG